MQWKQSVISIKDKQTIISHLEKSEKGTNLALKFKISKQQIIFRYTQREDPEIHWQCWDKRRIENTGFKGFSSVPLPLQENQLTQRVRYYSLVKSNQWSIIYAAFWLVGLLLGYML